MFSFVVWERLLMCRPVLWGNFMCRWFEWVVSKEKYPLPHHTHERGLTLSAIMGGTNELEVSGPAATHRIRG